MCRKVKHVLSLKIISNFDPFRCVEELQVKSIRFITNGKRGLFIYVWMSQFYRDWLKFNVGKRMNKDAVNRYEKVRRTRRFNNLRMKAGNM
jgi:hypothetical protein